MFNKIVALLFIINMLIAWPLAAQERKTINHTILTRSLLHQGYEDVIARTSSAVTVVQYEDSRNRNPMRGVPDIVARTSMLLPPTTRKVLILSQKYGVPLVLFESSQLVPYVQRNRQRNILVPQLVISPRADELIQGMAAYPAYDSPRLKSDLLVHPDIKMRFGNYNNPVEMQLNVVPELRTLLVNGLFLSASMVIPLYNELESVGNYVRLGPTTLNYLQRLHNDFFIFAVGGLFKGERYGVEGGIKKYFYSGLLTTDLRIGYSGYWIMDKGVFKYDYLKNLTYSLSAHYFMTKYKLFVSLGFYRFVLQDHGVRCDVQRFFDEFTFGLWGVYADNTANGGFLFSIPLPPRTYKRRGYFRLRMADYFALSYQGKYTSSSGIRLQANTILDDMFTRHHPHLLLSNIGRTTRPK